MAVVDYNWNRHGRIIDIGGAYGSFLASILAKHAKPQGVLFDQNQACPLLPTSADLALALHSAARHGATFHVEGIEFRLLIWQSDSAAQIAMKHPCR